MKLFLRYLRYRRSYLLFLAACVFVFSLVFMLYSFPLMSVIYPTLLCIGMGLVVLFCDFSAVKKRHAELQHLSELPAELIDELPSPVNVIEEDWEQVVKALCSENLRNTEKQQKDYSDMVDYYTIWAHQIKTPIASMRLNLQNEDSELSRRLRTDLNRTESYVSMVLTFLRLRSDSTDYVFRDCPLDSIIRPAVRRFAGDFISKKLSLNYTPPEITVLTDEKWLSFVIEQLLSNAVKYTESGSISIYTENLSTLCIKDTGIGIAPGDLPRIFERGYTGFNGRRDKNASGIGLYLCKTICDRLGHGLSVESVPGEGTVFRVDLSRKSITID